MRRRRLLGALIGLGLGACSDDGEPSATPSPSVSATSPTATPTLTRAATAAATSTPLTTPTPTATATATARRPALEPVGFPIDPGLRLGIVVGEPGRRTIAWGEGPAALAYSRDDQPAADPVRANRCGWDARVHVEYEGQPAVDWYVPVGTPVVATMDGTATLFVNTVSNPFDVYGVSREPYIGNPDRARAPISPFPGPGGGQGCFVSVANDGYVTTVGHLDVVRTIAAIGGAVTFAPGYTAGTDYARAFAELRDFRVQTQVAQWPVRRGDVLGMSGDSGYSEAPHVHYTVRRAGAGSLLCPTTEPGFSDAGWLVRAL